MTKNFFSLEPGILKSTQKTHRDFYKMERFKKSEDSTSLTELIRENMKEFDLKEKTLIATYRRLKNLVLHYSEEGNELYFIRDQRPPKPIACIGIGTFRGLPLAENIGEIRDLVVQKNFRNQGLGRNLLRFAIQRSQEIGFRTLYLETSKGMLTAQKLFTQFGFEPVEELPKKEDNHDELPCYYLLKDLHT